MATVDKKTKIKNNKLIVVFVIAIDTKNLTMNCHVISVRTQQYNRAEYVKGYLFEDTCVKKSN